MKLKENQEVFVFNEYDSDLNGFGRILKDTKVSSQDDIVIVSVNFSGETEETFGHVYEIARNRICKDCGHVILKNKPDFEDLPYTPYLCPECNENKWENQTRLITSEEYLSKLEFSKKYFLYEQVQDLIASQIPGADVKEIERWANVMMSNIASDKLIEEIEKTDFTSLASCDYKTGQKVWLYPYNEEDFQREVTIIKFDNEDNILVTDDNQITQDVVLCELHRKSEKVCPKCGRPLFHENYANTAEHYPYVCFGCDENFFEFEINPLLK